jgi:hypothetical protein
VSKPVSASSSRMTRWFLIGVLLVSCGLTVTGFLLRSKRVGLQDALERRVPELARELQVNARRYSRLYDEAEGAGLTGQKDPQTYLRDLARDKDVLIGATAITKAANSSPVKGVVDEKYMIRPQTTDRGFLRVNLANFMHLIEQRSRRMRVTHVRLTREGKPRENEYGNDRWMWEIEVTSRQKEGAE